MKSNPASIHGPESFCGLCRPCVEQGHRLLATVVEIPDLILGPPALGSQFGPHQDSNSKHWAAPHGRRQACHGPLLPSKQPRHRKKLLTLRLLDQSSQHRQFDSSLSAARLLIRHIWPVASPPSQASRTWLGHDRKQTRNKGREKTSMRSQHHVRVHKRP